MSYENKIKQGIRIFYYRILCKTLKPENYRLDPYEDAPIKQWLTKRVPGNRNSAVLLKVYGEFSNNKYLGWVKRKGRIAGVYPWARRKNENIIEVIFIGESSSIEKAIQYSWKGPANTKITNVKQFWFNKPSYKVPKVATHIKEQQGKPAAPILKALNSKELNKLLTKPNNFEDRECTQTQLIKITALERNLVPLNDFGKQNYIIGPNNCIGFSHSECSRISTTISSLADDKKITKDFLHSYDLPAPRGKEFTDYEEAKDFFINLNNSVVVKPTIGAQGTGVSVDVQTIDSFELAWEYAKKHCEMVIVEEFVEGTDVRILIVGGKAIGAMIRVPANIIGDGKSTVNKLIKMKNEERLKNPRLAKKLIIPDEFVTQFLSNYGYNLESVPKNGEAIFLHMKANLAAGGDSIDVTEIIHPDLMNLSEEVAKALNGVDFLGIDLMVERIDLPRNEQNCSIIEINTRAALRGIQWPIYGKGVNITEALLNHLFSERVTSDDYPNMNVVIKISGALSSSFYSWIESEAQLLNLKGILKGTENYAELHVTGPKNKVYMFFDKLWGKRGLDYFIDNLQMIENNHIQVDHFKIISSCKGLENAVITKREDGIFNLNSQNHNFEAINSLNKQESCLDITLFINEFRNQGYNAMYLGQNIIKAFDDKKEILTSTRFSSHFSDRICEKMHSAKKLLALNGLPVSRGVRFNLKQRSNILNYFETINSPIIVTSINPNDIKSWHVEKKSQLLTTIKQSKKSGTSSILLEEHASGWNVSIAVVGKQVIGALAIEPTTLTGDGFSSIHQLINYKNELRLKNPWYKDKLIKINKGLTKFLRDLDVSLDTILPKDQKIQIEQRTLFPFDGETVNISEVLHPDFLQHAIQAVEAIDGLEFAYVNTIVPNPTKSANEQKWIISNINTYPSVGMFQFPWKGKGINVTKEVVSNLCLKNKGVLIKKR